MRKFIGNIWTLDYHHVGVTVNLGWRHNGCAVMGKGIARQAVERYPSIVQWWGEICRTTGSDTPVTVHPTLPIVMVPTKRLDEVNPELSWRQNSDIVLVKKSLSELAALPGEFSVALPILGCGNGNLNPLEVMPLMFDTLSDRFVLVLQHC